MTKLEYADYQARVARFFGETGCSNLSCAATGDCEPYFSWRPCDCCRRPLGGDRHDANGYVPASHDIWEGSVCVDCIYYAEYGQLDDMTMIEIDEDKTALSALEG